MARSSRTKLLAQGKVRSPEYGRPKGSVAPGEMLARLSGGVR